MVELHTSRLILREFTPEDAAPLHAIESRPEVARYLWGEPESLDQIAESVNAFIGWQAEVPRRSVALAIALAGDPGLVGRCGLAHTGRAPGESELWYSLHPDYWGKGLMTEALQSLLGHGFGDLARHRIMAEVDPRNTGSWRVLQKLGLRREAHLVENFPYPDGSWGDTWLYAMLDREWPAASRT